jgi:hypothetical protein
MLFELFSLCENCGVVLEKRVMALFSAPLEQLDEQTDILEG